MYFEADMIKSLETMKVTGLSWPTTILTSEEYLLKGILICDLVSK
jgi:hypothetical protein